jgi:hypothetical protein
LNELIEFSTGTPETTINDGLVKTAGIPSMTLSSCSGCGCTQRQHVSKKDATIQDMARLTEGI